RASQTNSRYRAAQCGGNSRQPLFSERNRGWCNAPLWQRHRIVPVRDVDGIGDGGTAARCRWHSAAERGCSRRTPVRSRLVSARSDGRTRTTHLLISAVVAPSAVTTLAPISLPFVQADCHTSSDQSAAGTFCAASTESTPATKPSPAPVVSTTGTFTPGIRP